MPTYFVCHFVYYVSINYGIKFRGVITLIYNDVKDKIYGIYKATIACEENREGGCQIEMTFERDSRIKFREAFISLNRPKQS